jgi:hypothetical protein
MSCSDSIGASSSFWIPAFARITTLRYLLAAVIDKAQIDALLKGKWEGMKGALASGNIESAVNFFDEESKEHYKDIFTTIAGRLSQLVQEMQDIQIITDSGKDAKYRIRRNELYNGQSLTVTYYIYWGIDQNGLWKIIRY